MTPGKQNWFMPIPAQPSNANATQRNLDNAALASSAMRASKSVPMVLLKRCASGEASTSRPKAGAVLPSGPLRRGKIASDAAACGSASQLTTSKPVLTPQNGSLKEDANSLASSLTPCAKSAWANCGATSHTLIPTCGTAN